MEPRFGHEPNAGAAGGGGDGRGRRVGESMRGGLITRTALQEAMAVVGQDCECGLDRVWMQGERFPLAWGRAEKQAAFAELGFDPDNPKVKAEISRIMHAARIPGQAANRSQPRIILTNSRWATARRSSVLRNRWRRSRWSRANRRP